MMHTVSLGKPFYRIILVFPYPLNEIRGHADIDRAISFGRQDVYGGLLAHMTT